MIQWRKIFPCFILLTMILLYTWSIILVFIVFLALYLKKKKNWITVNLTKNDKPLVLPLNLAELVKKCC